MVKKKKPVSIILFLHMFLMILLINVFFIILNSDSVDNMKDRINTSIESILDTNINVIDNKISSGFKLIWWMKEENINFLSMQESENSDRYELYKGILYNEFNELQALMGGGLDVYFLCIKNRDDIIIWRNTKENSRESIFTFVRDVYGKDECKNDWKLGKIDDKDVLYLLVEQRDVYFGGVVYLDPFIEQINSAIGYEGASCCITQESGEEIEDTTRITRYSQTGRFYVNAYLDNKEMHREIVDSNMYIFIEVILILVVFCYLYIINYRIFIKPLKALDIALHNMENGNLDYRIIEKAKSKEFECTFLGFNNMAGSIQTLINENYKKQLDKEKMELENLQLQIRPHFLLNTFNLIYILSQKNKNHEIQDIILYLSAYFRYLFRSGNNLELFQKEQVLIEGYIKMAQVRYPDSIEIRYHYDPEIMMVRIPQLLLHNFVENVVKHVVKTGAVTHITIVGQYENGYVKFMIIDDGQGISEEKIKELNHSMRGKKCDGLHVGFYNSLKRIKYFYGENADILIESVEQAGTCVTVAFPYNLEETEESK